jgi:hypothetical protein
MDVKIIIPSRKRADTIKKFTLALMPSATVCVDESEVNDYAQFLPEEQILAHPPLPGLPSIRNWIIKNVPDRIIIMADDDLKEIMCMTGRTYTSYKKPDIVMQIIENAAFIADGIGARLFGFTQSARPYAFDPLDFIKFNTWIGTLVGVIGKEVSWDSSFRLRGDVDASLRELLLRRYTFIDGRFHFLSSERMKNKGGSTGFRSSAQDELEIARLKDRWGQYITFGTVSHTANGKAKRVTTFSPTLHVRRKQ